MPVSHLMFHSSFGPAIHIAGPQYFVLVIFIIITSLMSSPFVLVQVETHPTGIGVSSLGLDPYPRHVSHQSVDSFVDKTTSKQITDRKMVSISQF